MLSGTHPHYKSTIVHSLCHCCAFKLRPQSCGSRFFMNTGHKRSITQGIVGLNLDDCPPTNPPRFHPWYCHLPPTARALVLPRIAQRSHCRAKGLPCRTRYAGIPPDSPETHSLTYNPSPPPAFDWGQEQHHPSPAKPSPSHRPRHCPKPLFSVQARLFESG